MSVQAYTTAFDDLTFRCELQEDPHQTISRFRSELRTDIQWARAIHSQTIRTLAQANRLAQYIDASLKASSECRFVSKAGEQYRLPPEANIRPNTNTTKDPKDKSVIGEPSRQTISGTKCFRCYEYGHVAARCPTMCLLIEDAGLDEGNLEEDVYELEGGTRDTVEEVGYLI